MDSVVNHIHQVQKYEYSYEIQWFVLFYGLEFPILSYSLTSPSSPNSSYCLPSWLTLIFLILPYSCYSCYSLVRKSTGNCQCNTLLQDKESPCAIDNIPYITLTPVQGYIFPHLTTNYHKNPFFQWTNLHELEWSPCESSHDNITGNLQDMADAWW